MVLRKFTCVLVKKQLGSQQRQLEKPVVTTGINIFQSLSAFFFVPFQMEVDLDKKVMAITENRADIALVVREPSV